MGTKYEVDNDGRMSKVKDVTFTAQTAPTAAQGLLYFDSGTTKLNVSNDGATFKEIIDENEVSTSGGANKIVKTDGSGDIDIGAGQYLGDGSALTGVGGGAELGEVRQFAVSLSGAVTIASLQAKGFAICDGTTPSSQGISGATITTTPNLVDKFIRGDASASGATGGAATHTHSLSGSNNNDIFAENTFVVNTSTTGSASSLPPYYELVFMIKVK